MKTPTTKELMLAQAAIRETQRDRIDEIHDTCHTYLRNALREKYGQDVSKHLQDSLVRHMHDLTQQFMWGMDEAVIIHETIAKMEGRDPKEVNSALWSVRCKGAK